MPDIVIAFFALGLLAGLIKADLKVPQSIYETLSILLMLVLGLKGGMALHGKFELGMLAELLPIAALGLALPFVCYPILRRVVGLSLDDAVSVAAHYGSVSAGTFAVVLTLVEKSGMPTNPQTTLYLVMLELPSILIMLWFYRRHSSAGSKGSILREALTSRGVLLLGGGLLIGYLYGPVGLAPIKPVLLDGFMTMLALFLLEMGLCTAKVCSPLPLKHWRLMVFAAGMPFALAWVGIAASLVLRLPAGSAVVLASLTASASYIAAPAAIRAAIPNANIGLAMLAALGITFPINVLVGLPIYQHWVQLFY
ncbi:sodium-dependent bicarbonate transport family permease [Herbaspirillum sp. RTI4]|uniref:sodium-dependent bicarbonate transport family permease n=1 Tax=Herbaspirillum sp. RTI4 TaxID=3048640 RepID=UPI002AB3B18E|nr:sodium-dependent bicarbonate transport family permease [Herbaspirillum sp. RTI4]MDY7577282.1 sodium-dependent bicarbonate transport family permease [Herbaspirillum sp. RTI4]MEA9982952.1 sodium-dependent bicarbonate transport family permease [Herbaspirillum sp. RTI4]